MSQSLSQNEIDALLSAVSSGEVGQEGAPESSEPKGNLDWVAYDLASQEKFLRGRLVALEGIHERFCRLFRMSLLNIVKKRAGITYRNTEIIRFGEYLNGINQPTSLNVIKMKDPRGYMLFVTGSRLAYALIDAYYGGTERPYSKIGLREDFTSIEKNLIQKVVSSAISDYQEAWKLNYPLELSYVASESNPHFVGYIHNSESVAVVNFEVEFDQLSGPFIMVLQLRALDPIRQHLSVNVTREISGDVNMWREHWVKELMKFNVEVKAELGQQQVSLPDVLKWKKGDVVLLNQDAVDPVQVSVGGVPKTKGHIGLYRGSRAVRLVNSMKDKK